VSSFPFPSVRWILIKWHRLELRLNHYGPIWAFRSNLDPTNRKPDPAEPVPTCRK
jgi:hypothetical protein